MRQSQLFTHSLKELPKDESSFNAQTLMRAGFIEKISAGVYAYLPLGLRVFQKLKAIIRQEMANLGAQEVELPSLTPEEPWQQTGTGTVFAFVHIILLVKYCKYCKSAIVFSIIRYILIVKEQFC